MGVFFYDLLFFASACGNSRISIDALVTHLFAYIYIKVWIWVEHTRSLWLAFLDYGDTC
jgi:hypothetical protein